MRDYNGSNNADTYSFIGLENNYDMDPSAAFTISVWVVVDAYAQYRRLISYNSGNRGFQIVFPTASDQIGALTGSTTSGWGEPAGNPTKYAACTNGGMYHLWLTTEADDASRAFRFWVNGTEATSTDGVTGYNAGTSNSILNFGRRSDAAQYANCKIGEFCWWEGAQITDQATIDSVRYGMSPLAIRPDLSRLYIPMRTDALPVLVPNTGTGNVTTWGTAGTPTLSTTHPNVMLPGVRVRRRVPAASGATSVTPNGPAAITLTGPAPTPTVAASVAPGVGAISLTGYAPGLMISPQPGTAQIALTGLPPTPELAATVAPGVGELGLTGHAPELRLGAEPGTGAIIVTGYPPTVPDGDAPVDGPNLQGFLANVGSMMDR